MHNKQTTDDDGVFLWTMTPGLVQNNQYHVGTLFFYGMSYYTFVDDATGLLRPVINLKSNVVFKQGTDGSYETPYEIVME